MYTILEGKAIIWLPFMGNIAAQINAPLTLDRRWINGLICFRGQVGGADRLKYCSCAEADCVVGIGVIRKVLLGMEITYFRVDLKIGLFTRNARMIMKTTIDERSITRYFGIKTVV